MFDFLFQGSKAYAKRREAMLRESMFARMEHEAAAEHHEALSRMYADRIVRLKKEAMIESEGLENPTPVIERRLSERGNFWVFSKRDAGAEAKVQGS